MDVRLVGFGGSRLLGIAGQIVQYVAEVKKPNEKRYEEYVDANLDSLRNELLSPAPIHADLEVVTLTDQLQLALDKLGPEHPFVRAALDGKTPAEAAKAAVAGTKLQDPATRKALLDGGAAAVAASTDSMIVLARRIDPMARETRRFLEDEVDAPTTRAMEKIAQARWKVYGRTVSPDATFTLRLSYGTVKGFPAEGTEVAPFTTFYGLFDRSVSHGGKAPWALPARWKEKAARDRRLGAARTSSRRTTSSAATRAARSWTAPATSWGSSSTATSRASPGTTTSPTSRAARWRSTRGASWRRSARSTGPTPSSAS